MNQIVEKWPTLYHKARTGALHEWQVSVDGEEIVSRWGQVDGQHQETRKRATPKNIGRMNATTAYEQAVLEAEAMHKFKLERKYSTTPEGAQEDVLLPMLAHSFEKYEKKITYPVDVQPKLDGVRALARWEGDRVILISRGGKEWKVTTHINEALEKFLPRDAVLDGEIYLHGKGFQWITARTKKRQEGTEQLQYHVYDMPEVNEDDSLPWSERRGALSNLMMSRPAFSHQTIQHVVREEMLTGDDATSRDDVVAAHDRYIQAGYEGAIIRALGGVYEYGHRSPSLLKMKAFDDGEYKIVGHTSGVGKEADLVIWRCEAPNGLQFETRPRGAHEERRELLKEAESHYGQMLTVRFFGLTDEGLPRFPVGIGIRATEDM